MQNKDKHFLEKKLTSNQITAYNCDCFQYNLNNNIDINNNDNNNNNKKNHDELPTNSCLLRPHHSAQIMSNAFFTKSYEKNNSLQPPLFQYASQTFVPFKKRSFDQLSSSTQDMSRVSNNNFNGSNNITGDLNKRSNFSCSCICMHS